MANETEEVMIVSDNELDVSQRSLQLNQSMESIGSVGSVESDVNEANDEMNDTKESINSNKSVGSVGSNGSNANKSVNKKRKKLSKTEKELQNKERERRKEEKERELKERKELFEKQRLERQRIKDSEKEKRERERVEKEAERVRIKEEKQREREEKQKERDFEKLKKEEEILEKKRKLDEEKQRKTNEKLKLTEEEERRKSKQRQFFNKFLIKKPSDDSNNKNVLAENQTFANGLFLPFQLSANQTIAPIVSEFAKQRFNRQELDHSIESQNTEKHKLYLNSIKSNEYLIFKRNKREKVEPEVIIESPEENDDNQLKKFHIKHLQFHQNVRPAYRGTFRKRSCLVKPKQPFNKDSNLFDYDVDSDEDWEEGGPGESLDGSESDGSAKDDYEIDNDFFVPHGYLSEDENDENEEKLNVSANRELEMTDDKNDQKEPLLKEQVLMAERNRAFTKTLTPLLIGCVWESSPDNNQKFVDSLQQFKRMSLKIK